MIRNIAPILEEDLIICPPVPLDSAKIYYVYYHYRKDEIVSGTRNAAILTGCSRTTVQRDLRGENSFIQSQREWEFKKPKQ